MAVPWTSCNPATGVGGGDVFVGEASFLFLGVAVFVGEASPSFLLFFFRDGDGGGDGLSPPFLLPPLVDLVGVGIEQIIGVTTAASVFVLAAFFSPLSLFPPAIYVGL